MSKEILISATPVVDPSFLGPPVVDVKVKLGSVFGIFTGGRHFLALNFIRFLGPKGVWEWAGMPRGLFWARLAPWIHFLSKTKFRFFLQILNFFFPEF